VRLRGPLGMRLEFRLSLGRAAGPPFMLGRGIGPLFCTG
jgi:hypothetical protein